MRIALVEPYFGGSHQAFAEGLRDNSSHQIELFTHQARFWKWRMNGSYLTLGNEFAETVDATGPFDLIVATDMLHVPAFLGVVGAARGTAPLVLYMHENQLTYPWSPRDTHAESFALINWASMAVADLVLFNSNFHLAEWSAGIGPLLNRLPDYRHSSLVADVAAKSEVVELGVDLARLGRRRHLKAPRDLVLWNQRWDFDKGMAMFASVITEVSELADFDVALAGEAISEVPEFTRLIETLGDRVVHVGYAPETEYVALLRKSTIVVSTALQEFFGIAVTEAIYAGAFPLLPNELVYPERIAEYSHQRCLYSDRRGLVRKLRWALSHPHERSAIADHLSSDMAAYDWRIVAEKYDRVFQRVVDASA